MGAEDRHYLISIVSTILIELWLCLFYIMMLIFLLDHLSAVGNVSPRGGSRRHLSPVDGMSRGGWSEVIIVLHNSNVVYMLSCLCCIGAVNSGELSPRSKRRTSLPAGASLFSNLFLYRMFIFWCAYNFNVT